MLPRPVALASEGDSPGGLRAGATPESIPAETATATVEPTATVVPTVTPTPVTPGTPIRVVIPSIEVDSKVKEAGTYWQDGQQYYETLPWVVAHYRFTAKAGEVGNAVLTGHVTSKAAGNVFADLYKVQLGDVVRLYSEDNEFTYVVTDIRLVDPSDVGVMDSTPDATVTLITCAGEWIPSEHQYTQRLIVTAKLKR